MIDEAFGNWLAGFIDGEGCFTIRDNKGSDRKSLVCEFHINLRRDDDAILSEIAAKTGLGRIYFAAPSRTTDRNAQPQVRWLVSRRSQLLKLIDLLDRFPLRAKKARDYAVWREAVLAWQSVRLIGTSPNRTRNAPIWIRMKELKEHLEAGRAYETAGRAVELPVESPAQLHLRGVG